MDKVNKIDGEITHNGADEEKKITLPKELQTEMLKFFYKTSMPRIKKAKAEAEQAEKADGIGEATKAEEESESTIKI